MLNRAPTRVVRNWVCDSRQWEGYRPREGDVVIATAPKVGTTWTQQIVNLLIFQSTEPRPLGMLSPWIDCRFQMPVEVALQVIEAQPHRRFLKSHLPLDALPIYDEVKYIHTARDGRDACFSFLNHFNSFTPEAWAKLDAVGLNDPTIGQPVPRTPRTGPEFFRRWVGGADSGSPMMSDMFFDIERSYWAERARPNLLLTHYNDLKADLGGEMRRIAEFLEIEVPQALWPDLIEAATFDGMKRDGDALLAGMEVAFDGGHRSFLHKGTNDRWRTELTPEDVALYEAKVKAELPAGLKAWLEGGRAAAGNDPRSAPN
jgi:aryl sulfotransferase